ncbi:MAG TPA: FAD-binding oxidoreductase [Actinomycetota bacterium]|nr:FAD-binding oxidoreductase [Actinomycetota bacterium]
MEVEQGTPPVTDRETAALIEEARRRLTGRVIGPGDPGYDEARLIVYGGFDRRPALIARAANADDVSQVIALARSAGLDLAIRSGGHSQAGHSATEGGIVLDLRDMKGIDIDVAERTAWAETGLTAGEYSVAVAEHGLATGFGDTGSVGIGGITLGGGVGFLVRKHGLTVDNLLAAEVVTADGEVVFCDEHLHPDLFWAIRGGGGNFGVATRFKFRLHELGSIFGGMLFLPASVEVITGFMAAAEAAPEEVSGIANVMVAPPLPFVPEEVHGKLIVMAMLVYAGDPEAGERALAPFRALAPALMDMLRPMSYPEMFPPEDDSYHPTAVGLTLFLDSVDDSVAATILRYLEDSDASLRVAQLRVLGGAMARVPADATAFAHRKSRIMANVAAFYDGLEDKPRREEWVNGFASALRQSDQGAYVGFLADEGEGRVRAAYPGETWERLRSIKAKYDPDNFFRLNQNIPPAE